MVKNIRTVNLNGNATFIRPNREIVHKNCQIFFLKQKIKEITFEKDREIEILKKLICT